MHPKSQEFARGRAEIAEAVHNAIRIENFGGVKAAEQSHLQSNYFLRLHMHLDHLQALGGVSEFQKAKIEAGETARGHDFGLSSEFYSATGAMVPDGVIAKAVNDAGGNARNAGKNYELDRLSTLMERIEQGRTGYAIPQGRTREMMRFMLDLQLEGHGVDMKNLQAVHAGIAVQDELSQGQVQATAWMRDVISDLRAGMPERNPAAASVNVSLSQTHERAASLFPVQEVMMAPKKVRGRAAKRRDIGQMSLDFAA